MRVVLVRARPPRRDYYRAPEVVRIRRDTRDIMHCQGCYTLVAPLAMLAGLSARTPYVVTLHSGGHSSRLRRAQARLLRPLLRRSDQVIASSPFEAGLFARRPEQPTARPPLLLSIGRLATYKSHHRIIEALPGLEQVRPGTRLRVVGTGPYETDLRSLANQLGAAHMLEIASVPAARHEMARLLQRAACVLMLSEYESQRLAIQEAVGLDRPVVVSDNSALRDLGEHGNVRTVDRQATSDDIAATILELLAAPAVTLPQLFTWGDCATALLDVYLDMLAGHR